MALTRFNGNVVPFASESTTDNRTVFGDVVQADDIDSNLNADFKKGWEIVGLNDNPTKQDFNAMGYTLGALISYLYQMGIAEYNASQEYKLNAVCIGTDGTIYQSLVDANIGNALNDVSKWKNINNSFVDLVNNQSIDGIKNFGKSPIVPTPTTGTQAANKAYVDSAASVPDASTTVKGIVELATDAEIRTGTDNIKAITPLGYNQTTLGWGQTWQDVTSSRSTGVTYTNNTGKPIVVSFSATTTISVDGYAIANITVDGVFISRSSATSRGQNLEAYVSAIVPNQSSYVLTIDSGSKKRVVILA